jgi:hypothetical protein
MKECRGERRGDEDERRTGEDAVIPRDIGAGFSRNLKVSDQARGNSAL